MLRVVEEVFAPGVPLPRPVHGAELEAQTLVFGSLPPPPGSQGDPGLEVGPLLEGLEHGSSRGGGVQHGSARRAHDVHRHPGVPHLHRAAAVGTAQGPNAFVAQDFFAVRPEVLQGEVVEVDVLAGEDQRWILAVVQRDDPSVGPLQVGEGEHLPVMVLPGQLTLRAQVAGRCRIADLVAPTQELEAQTGLHLILEGKGFVHARQEAHRVLKHGVREPPRRAVVEDEMPLAPPAPLVAVDDPTDDGEAPPVVDPLGAELHGRGGGRRLRDLAHTIQVGAMTHEDRVAVPARRLDGSGPAE